MDSLAPFIIVIVLYFLLVNLMINWPKSIYYSIKLMTWKPLKIHSELTHVAKLLFTISAWIVFGLGKKRIEVFY